MPEKIFIVDDEIDIRELVSVHLKKNNFQVQGFENYLSLSKALKKEKPSLLLLDLMLPDKDGMDICKELKQDSRYAMIPIIMLTAKTDEMDKVLGLEFGADDYITKPFSPRELVARIKAVLRRSQPIFSQKIMEIDKSLKINFSKHEVFVKKEKVNLTLKEFNILALLAQKQGWVYSREQILDAVWGNDDFVYERTVDVHIKHLREKLKDVAHLIKNVRGLGYKLEA